MLEMWEQSMEARAPGFGLGSVPLEVYPDVVSEEEEAAILSFVEPVLKRRPYEQAHWDSVIDQFREMERPLAALPPPVAAVAERLRCFFRADAVVMPAVHFLDLSSDGEIRHHVDSIKFSGPHIVILSLLSPALINLRHQHSEAQIEFLAPRRSVYVLRDTARYDWSHAVCKGETVFCPDGAAAPTSVRKDRRISFIMRDDLPPAPPGTQQAGRARGQAQPLV